MTNNPVGVLFCADPLRGRRPAPDPDFAAEHAAAIAAGMPWGLLDHDALTDGPDQDALCAPRLPAGCRVLYRGWMLTPAQYDRLDALVRRQGSTLLTPPSAYRTGHLLPEAYPHLAPHTAPTAWIHATEGADLLAEGLRTIADLTGERGGVVLKDHVKSLQHLWATACFVPDVADHDHTARVLQRFLSELGTSLVGGLVVRRALPLRRLGSHPDTGAPLIEEYRRFYLNGRLLGQGLRAPPPASSSSQPLSPPPLEHLAAVAARFPSPFFSMDIAPLEVDAGWVIIEVGDGQVSSLPPNLSPTTLYAALSQDQGARSGT